MVDLPDARRIYSIKGTSAEVLWANKEGADAATDVPIYYRMFAVVGCPLATQDLIDGCKAVLEENYDTESVIFTKQLSANYFEIIGFLISPATDYADIYSVLVDHYREYNLLPSSHVLTGEELFSRYPSWLVANLKDNHNVIIALGTI